MGKHNGRRSNFDRAGVAKLVAVGLFGVVTLSLAGYALAQDRTAPATTVAYSPMPIEMPTQAAAQTISVVGDSNTEVNSSDFSAGDIGDASWVSQLLGDGFTFGGGWADGGTTSGTQADNLAQLDQADITLIMTGTNDLGQGVAFADTRANIDRIVAKAPANRVILLAIPPRDTETRRTTEEHNADLQQLAQERGWEFFDGLTFLRAPEGGYIAGVSDDGVHLNREAQARYGQIIREHLAA
ncbi:SGNH/GDSL hydrolase family protein [Microbacterium enclense]|uniref:Lysophospholipase L1 n=1 Tax=Microbacterium enclense TaxID=993073 RepID=A0A1G6NXG0_9MICO|nr:SGNH/GDSL hydrolase family protein [Microbacterium enclense]KSU52909.1 hypothetical protein AS029_12945 [Microbacterium enclense]SDC71936.1 Lysophospholipase L1 [Microbacterium enclense]